MTAPAEITPLSWVGAWATLRAAKQTLLEYPDLVENAHVVISELQVLTDGLVDNEMFLATATRDYAISRAKEILLLALEAGL